MLTIVLTIVITMIMLTLLQDRLSKMRETWHTVGAWSLRGSRQRMQSRRGDGPSTPDWGSPSQNNQSRALSSTSPNLTLGLSPITTSGWPPGFL